MPGLKEIEEKYFEGFKVDKENKDTVYSDEQHVYLDKQTKEKYVSVTQLIHSYCSDFDEEFWSAYKALEALLDEQTWIDLKISLLNAKKFNKTCLKDLKISEEEFDAKQNEIKAEYKKKRDDACDRGTKIHALFENSFYNKTDFDFSKFGLSRRGKYVCKSGYYELDLEKGVYPEFLISVTSSDGFLKVAGQIDLLIKDGNDIDIIDFKTNAEIKKQSYFNKRSKKYEMMKYPLNKIMDCNYYHYCLQLSTYAYMLQHIRPEFNIKSLTLIHIDHDGKQHNIECPYLKEEVEKMLKDYKKKIKIKKALDRDKPFVFE